MNIKSLYTVIDTSQQRPTEDTDIIGDWIPAGANNPSEIPDWILNEHGCPEHHNMVRWMAPPVWFLGNVLCKVPLSTSRMISGSVPHRRVSRKAEMPQLRLQSDVITANVMISGLGKGEVFLCSWQSFRSCWVPGFGLLCSCCYVVLKGKGGNTGRSSREFVLVFSSLPVPDLFSFQPRWTVAICRPRFRRVSPQAAGADKCDVQCRS